MGRSGCLTERVRVSVGDKGNWAGMTAGKYESIRVMVEGLGDSEEHGEILGH